MFYKWYKDTRKKIIPVQILSALSTESEMKERPSPIPERKPEVDTRLSSYTELRILVDIRMNNGAHISQKNLSYEGLKSLVEKLEGLCWNITGLNRFFFVRDFHDMRCKYDKVLSIIHQQLNREPEDGDV